MIEIRKLERQIGKESYDIYTFEDLL